MARRSVPSPSAQGLTLEAVAGSSFRPCPDCGTLVQWRTWQHGTLKRGAWWEALAAPVSPALGIVHECRQQSDLEEEMTT